MRRLKRAACLFLLPICAAFLCGCWNNRPVSQLAIVVGMAFDKAPGGVQLTAQVVVPSNLHGSAESSGGSGGNATANVTVTGETAFDSVRNLLSRLNRKAYFAHVQVLAFGSDFAKDGIDKVWDFMERDNEFGRMLRVVVVKDGTARQLLLENSDVEKISSLEVADMLDSSGNFGKSVEVKSFDLTELLSQPNAGIVAGLIELKGASVLSESSLEGASILKNAKLVGYYSPNEARGYLFAMNKITSTILVLDNPEEAGKKISLEVIRSTGKITTDVKNGNPTYAISVQAFGNIGDEQGTDNLFKEKDFAKIEAEASALIRQEITAAADVSRKYACDVFNVNKLLFQYHYAEYKKMAKQWDEIYSKMPPEISVTFRLDRSGLIDRPAYHS